MIPKKLPGRHIQCTVSRKGLELGWLGLNYCLGFIRNTEKRVDEPTEPMRKKMQVKGKIARYSAERK